MNELSKLQRLEDLAHEKAFTDLGTFYYEKFLIELNTYVAKYGYYIFRY